ncbi:isoprenylcysteine carboxylmethyltransferase family protein [Desulfitobacterium sp. AusDCA]|uniref:isoprenylcysteine carboxylmethyltransferase family protein n=1 Tax=Desulfitobacterium sp. AusDCA TaxID=3240383 RepID=UPI003DA71410
MEMFFRVSFFLAYGSFFLLRRHYVNPRKVEETPSSLNEGIQEAVKNEGKLSVAFRGILSVGLITSLILYLVSPDWISNLSLPIPSSLRMFGLIGAVSSLPLLYFIHQELGKYWSPDLIIQEDHQLVTTGVYHWVRHPMYSALTVFMAGISLLSANLIIILPHALTLLSLYSRIEKEEKMMEKRFGEEYLKYEKHTGRLLPRIPLKLMSE